MRSGTRKSSTRRRRTARFASGFGLCSATFCAPAVWAQSAPFNVETYESAPAATGTLGVDGTAVPTHLAPTADASLHRSESPVVFRADEVVRAIDDRWTLDLGLGLGLFGNLQLDARLPLIAAQSGIGLGDGLDGISAGDLRLRAKWRLLDRDLDSPIGFAVQAALYVPTGDRGGYSSDGVVRFEPRLVADARVGQTLIIANAGYQLRGRRDLSGYRHDDALRWGLAARHPLFAGIDVEAAAHGEHSLLPATIAGAKTANRYAHPVEALGGVGWTFQGLRTSVGGGAGLTRGLGSPDYRVIVSLGYDPRASLPESYAGRRVVAHDFDEDGLAGDADACPYAAETFDGFEDDDGCPDLDDDGDRVPDELDLCPDQVGLVSKSGCAAADSDADGVDDAADACPLLAGTADADGCPHRRDSPEWRAQFVALRHADVEEAFPEAVFFPTGHDRFKPEEHPLLERLADRLRDDPAIVKLVIEGHTDSIGGAERNFELARGRAQTVHDVLVRRGVDPSRLDVVAYGEERPIDTNETPEGRARNRRVAFRMIVRRWGRETEVTDVPGELVVELTLADFEFERRNLIGLTPPRFLEGTVLTAPRGWTCTTGNGAPDASLTLRTVGAPVVRGLHYPGWTTTHQVECRRGESVVEMPVEVEIPPFGVRVDGAIVAGTTGTSEVDVRFAGRAVPLDVEVEGYRFRRVALSADAVRMRLDPTGESTGSAARFKLSDRVLLNVPFATVDDEVRLEPLPQERRFIEIGAGSSFISLGRTRALAPHDDAAVLPGLRFTARALATNWFAVGVNVDVAGMLGADPILFTPGFGAEAVVHAPIRVLRPFASTGVQTWFPALEGARPSWEMALGIDYEPAAGAGLRAAARGTVFTNRGELYLLPGGFIGAYTTF